MKGDGAMRNYFGEIIKYQKTMREFDPYCDQPLVKDCPVGAVINIAGVGKVINFNTLQYLGNLGLARKAASHLNTYGFGLACSPLLIKSEAVMQFEQDIAQHKGYSEGSCCSFATGYNAAESAMQLLVNLYSSLVGGSLVKARPPVIVFVDAFTHVSIQKPLMPFRKNICKKQKIRTVTYRHLDYNDLSEKLGQYKDSEVDKIIVTDTVFSMHGDVVDVLSIYNLAQEHGAFVLLDGAHSDGVYGKQGRGFLFQEGLEDIDRSIFLEVGTLSKSLASDRGGFMLFPREIIDFTKKSAVNFIFSSGLAPFAAATASDAIGIIQGSEGDILREKLQSIVEYAFNQLAKHDFNTLESKSQIIPILVGDHDRMYRMYNELMKQGIFVGRITHPAVEKNGALLRIVLTANHDHEHVNALIKGLRIARDSP